MQNEYRSLKSVEGMNKHLGAFNYFILSKQRGLGCDGVDLDTGNGAYMVKQRNRESPMSAIAE